MFLNLFAFFKKNISEFISLSDIAIRMVDVKVHKQMAGLHSEIQLTKQVVQNFG